MDTWGLIIIVIGLVVWLLARRKSDGFAKLGLYVFGVGSGILIGSFWALALINKYMGAYMR